MATWRAVWAALPNNPVMAARFTYLTTREDNRLHGIEVRGVGRQPEHPQPGLGAGEGARSARLCTLRLSVYADIGIVGLMPTSGLCRGVVGVRVKALVVVVGALAGSA